MHKIPTIYLCGPIAGCNDNEAKDWREYVKSKRQWTKDQTGLHFHCLDPMRRDYRKVDFQLAHSMEFAKEIVELDKIDIAQSDAVLVHLTPGKTSYGSIMETMYAWEKGKLVVVVKPDTERAGPWLYYHSQLITNNVDNALAFILQYFEGGQPFESIEKRLDALVFDPSSITEMRKVMRGEKPMAKHREAASR